MENQPENSDLLIKQINRQKKIMLFSVLFSVGILLFVLWYIFLGSTRDKAYEKEYKKEMAILAKRMDSLRANEQIIIEAALQIRDEVVVVKKEKENSDKKLQYYINQLTTLKKGYEKNPTYINVSLDSLSRIHSNRFNHD